MKLHSITAYLIVLMVISLAAGLNAEKSHGADFEPYMQIGLQANASDAHMGGLGVIYKNKLDLSFNYIGRGNTKWGKHEPMRVVSLVRIVTPGWFNGRMFLGVGYANVQDSLLVGEHNAKLMFGWQELWGRIYFAHISDFGVGSNNNTGLDGGHVGLNLSW